MLPPVVSDPYQGSLLTHPGAGHSHDHDGYTDTDRTQMQMLISWPWQGAEVQGLDGVADGNRRSTLIMVSVKMLVNML